MVKILIDLDATLIDSHKKLLDQVDSDQGFTPEDITSYSMRECFPKEFAERLYEVYGSEDFYDHGIDFYEGAKQAINELSNQGHTILFVSYPMNGHIKSKHQFIESLPEKGVPMDGYFLGQGRKFIDADVLIDDRPESFEEFKSVGLKLMKEQPYNEEYKIDGWGQKFSSWSEVSRIISYEMEVSDLCRI